MYLTSQVQLFDMCALSFLRSPGHHNLLTSGGYQNRFFLITVSKVSAHMIFAMHFIGVFRDTKIWCILLMFFWICNRVSSNDIKLPKFISFCCVIYDFSVIILNKCRFNTSNSKVITVNVICDSAEKYPPKLLNPYLSFLVNSTLVNLKK